MAGSPSSDCFWSGGGLSGHLCSVPTEFSKGVSSQAGFGSADGQTGQGGGCD